MVAMALVLCAYSQECEETLYNRQICDKTSLSDVYKFSINLSCENNVVDFSFNICANGDTETVIVEPYENQYTPYSNLAKTFNEKTAGQGRFDIYIHVYKTQCASVCLSAIEVKLETFRYKQTYESYITFYREAKYGILISIRIVFGGLRAYIYSTVAKCATNSCHKITS